MSGHGDIINRLKKIKGPLTDNEGATLYDFAKIIKPDQYIVEIGSYLGRSTCFLSLGSFEGNNATVYAIDLWGKWGLIEGNSYLKKYIDTNNFKEFQNNIESINTHNIEFEQNDSISKSLEWNPKHKIGLLFIDGDHTYKGVKNDFDNWRKHLTKDAYVIFHDYSKHWEQVVIFVNECIDSKLITKIKHIDSLYVSQLI